ncbi:MAG TPA: restriction endonuclease [Burkholderiales bacterium]|nr:restriction endonuclease [Burkholderiales bacterium]
MSDELPPGGRSNAHLFIPLAAHARSRVSAHADLSILGSVDRNNALLDTPSLLLQAVVITSDKTAEGILIQSAAVPWFEIVGIIQRSPESIYSIHWRKWEEIIAGAYKQAGFDVVLTPRSNDKGRDVIATRPGIGSVCFFDPVKANHPGNLVTFEEVSAMLGVLSTRPNVSKGIITTTSSFAPGVLTDPELARFMPYRLELKARDTLLPWLQSLAGV